MKKTCFSSVILLLAAVFAHAQSPEAAAPALPAPATDTGEQLARANTERLRDKYVLDAGQVAKMYAIQRRKQRNLAEIERFKSSDPALYRNKLKSIQQGTQASIGRMLNTEAQRQIYQQTKAEQRKQRADKQQELSARGAGKEAVEAAILAIYLE